MIGGIKTRPLKHDTDRRVHFMQIVLSALGTFGQRLVCEFLGLVELDATIVAPIGIYRHTCTSISSNRNPAHYSLIKEHGQERVLVFQQKNYSEIMLEIHLKWLRQQMTDQNADANANQHQSPDQFHAFAEFASQFAADEQSKQ